MISQALPRIRLGPNLGMDEFAQALAFTYLASYCDQAIQPRVFDAYSRAWGTNTIQLLPNQADNNPGCAMSYWEGEGLRHCLVAIPGATSTPSLMSMIAGAGYHSVAGCTGSVFHAFRTRAYTMWDRLHAHPRFMGVLTNNRNVVTFTGHSLGAAMAEILAYRFKQAYPWKEVRCIKFASPRVGTSRWVDNADVRVKFASIYFERDPIHHFPYVSSDFAPLQLATAGLLMRNFVRDSAPWRLIVNHYHWVNDYVNAFYPRVLLYAAQSLQAFVPSNPWFDHTVQSYRLAFMSYCAIRQDTLKYRFNYLEHNDENQWQKLHSPGMREWAAINVLDPFQPDPTPPISTQVEFAVNAAAQVQQVAPILPDVAAESDGLGGGDWGTPLPVSSAYFPRRRVRAVLPP